MDKISDIYVRPVFQITGLRNGEYDDVRYELNVVELIVSADVK